jgi:hypothetical protein
VAAFLGDRSDAFVQIKRELEVVRDIVRSLRGEVIK